MKKYDGLFYKIFIIEKFYFVIALESWENVKNTLNLQ